jgi:hypothetical protein
VNGRSAGRDSGAGSTGGTGGTGPSRISPASLAVEVMSPGSVTEDRITKPAVYARAGIPHYWRLESGDEGELALYVYRLAGDVHTEAACFRGDDRVEIDEPLRLRVPVGSVARLVLVSHRHPLGLATMKPAAALCCWGRWRTGCRDAGCWWAAGATPGTRTAHVVMAGQCAAHH